MKSVFHQIFLFIKVINARNLLSSIYLLTAVYFHEIYKLSEKNPYQFFDYILFTRVTELKIICISLRKLIMCWITSIIQTFIYSSWHDSNELIDHIQITRLKQLAKLWIVWDVIIQLFDVPSCPIYALLEQC